MSTNIKTNDILATTATNDPTGSTGSGTGSPVTPPAPTPPPPTDPTPTATPSLTDVATALLASFTTWLAEIPEFVNTHPSGKHALSSNRLVKPEFIFAAIAAVQSSPALQGLGKFDVTAAQDALQFTTAFEPLVVKLQTAARDLQFSIDSKKARSATEALQIYEISKGLVRDPSSAGLLSYLDQMKKTLGRTGRKKKGTTTPPAPTPAPAPTAPAAEQNVSLTATVPTATVAHS